MPHSHELDASDVLAVKNLNIAFEPGAATRQRGAQCVVFGFSEAKRWRLSVNRDRGNPLRRYR
ncbi:glutathione transporter ATP-binding protein [Citrobacter koseri]|uniref:Glutathione transporter ATP-binding protein n=1 Tax=Citrobacter koseri TaxID=545 RepID=A0A2X2X3S7_CITKO|nr:glutathione transporter ATP-binding protein [Citrobacter koseri]